MNQLTRAERAQIIACLVEGNSIRATVRMTGKSKNTIAKLLLDLGAACTEYQDQAFRNLKCKRLQCDEIWSFVYAKEKNVPSEKKNAFGYGDVWTWTAIDVETKLVPAWMVGPRDLYAARCFTEDLASRLAGRVQITTDGLKAYVEAVEGAFGGEVDFAQLVKIYGNEGQPRDKQVRYSPAVCTGARKIDVQGKPDPAHVSTSHVERQNLTMRMGMRRFTRLTNALSKKLANHEAAIALHFMYYNFARIHQTLRVTPAMEAGVSDRVWSLEEIAALLEK